MDIRKVKVAFFQSIVSSDLSFLVQEHNDFETHDASEDQEFRRKSDRLLSDLSFPQICLHQDQPVGHT